MEKRDIQLITVIPIKGKKYIKDPINFYYLLHKCINSAINKGSQAIYISNYPEFADGKTVFSIECNTIGFSIEDKLNKLKELFNYIIKNARFTHVHLLDCDDEVIKDINEYLQPNINIYFSQGFVQMPFGLKYLDSKNTHLKNGSNLILSKKYLINKVIKKDIVDHYQYPFTSDFKEIKKPIILQKRYHSDNIYFINPNFIKIFIKTLYAFWQQIYSQRFLFTQKI